MADHVATNLFAHVQNLRKISSYVNPMASSSLLSVVETTLVSRLVNLQIFSFPSDSLGRKTWSVDLSSPLGSSYTTGTLSIR